MNTETTTAAPAKPPPRIPTTLAFASVTDWCALSGMGRSTTYEALGAGHLRAVKLGAKTLIDVPHGLEWLGSLPRADIRPHSAKRTKQAV